MEEASQRGIVTRSEAVYLDCVSDDGSAGFVTRVCRFPDAGFCWVWAHVFHADRVMAFTSHSVRCEGGATNLAAERVRYQASWADGLITCERQGDCRAPVRAEIDARFSAHLSRHAPHGAGRIPCRIEAVCRPATGAVSNLAGRTEVLGDVSARVLVGDEQLHLRGRGQFHEQVQTEPRFTTPFSYLTLRGEGLGVIAVRGAHGARGHLLRGESVAALDDVALTPPGTARRVRFSVVHGETLAGELLATYDYSVPVFGGYRPGTLVAGWINGVAVSGCVNDFLLDQLPFERWD